jgi:hypothetical protein
MTRNATIRATASSVGLQSPLSSSPPAHHCVGGATKITRKSPQYTRNVASAVCAIGTLAAITCAGGVPGVSPYTSRRSSRVP